MLEKSFPLTLTLFVDLVDADLLVPRSYREMFACGRKSKIRDAIFGRRVERYIFGNIACSVCLTSCCRRSADVPEERHSNGRAFFSLLFFSPGLRGM